MMTRVLKGFISRGMQRFLEESSDDDVLCKILSFLSPCDVASCAAVSRRVSFLCRDDNKLWLPMCQARWGTHTCLKKWIHKSGSTMPYRDLFKILSNWENLIGFWRGVVGTNGQSQLLVFQYGIRSIQGFRIVAASKDSFQVRKIPFLWLGAAFCVLNPGVNDKRETYDVPEECTCHGHAPDSRTTGNEDAFARMDQTDWGIGDLETMGLALADVQFVGKNHIVVEEIGCYRHQVERKKMSLAEAAASASFGLACDENGYLYGNSPPGSFPYEMFRFLTGKVTSPGSDRAMRKQRKKEKERAESRGRRYFDQQHFVKVVDSSPTKARPLQGLWKGIRSCKTLDFILLSYDEHNGKIMCRQVGETSGRTRNEPVDWTADSVNCSPPSEERELYKHVTDKVTGVLTMFMVNGESGEKVQGRIWVYESGMFGLLRLHSNFVLNFRLISSRDCLLDVVD